MPPTRTGCTDGVASYCNSIKRPAFEAVGVVIDLVVVRVSNTKAAYDSLVESGVEDKESMEERK